MALVAGEPIFLGDMIFEANQMIEKHMSGAPRRSETARIAASYLNGLLPKYVDQKMLYIATTSQLPAEANMEDVIKQAEKTFNEKALPDIMEKSGVRFGNTIRCKPKGSRDHRFAKCVASWAKDQVSRFFLSEQVKFSRDVTHFDLLKEYREGYDSYAKSTASAVGSRSRLTSTSQAGV